MEEYALLGVTSDSEMEGKALLAEASLQVAYNAEVRVVRMP